MNYQVQVRKSNLEWNDVGVSYVWLWLASLEGAKWLRAGWQVRIEDLTNE